MANKINPEAGKLQFVWEGILKWAVLGLGCLHMLLSLLRYYDADIRTNMLKVEKWFLIVLLLGVIAYVLYTKIRTPRLFFRIGNFAKGLFRPELKILIVFYLWYLICVISANDAYTANFWQLNDGYLFNCFISFFVLFIVFYLFPGDSGKRLLEIIFHVFAITLTIAMIYVLWAVFKPSVITLPSGGQIGMTRGGSLCINCNQNTTGAIAEVVFMFCVYMVVAKKGIVRWLYLAASIVHYYVVILSNSRTCIVASGIAVGAVLFTLCFRTTTKRSLGRRIVLSSVVAVVVFGLVVGLQPVMYKIFNAVSHFSEQIGRSDATLYQAMDVSTGGRIKWWKASVQSVFTDVRHFFFGVTPAGVISEINRLTGKQLYTHNQFCEIMVSNGIPGVLMYLGWLVMIARTCVRMLMGKAEGLYRGVEVILGMILMLVIANLMEATLLYYHWFPEEAFFLVCGFVTYRYAGEPKRLLKRK